MAVIVNLMNEGIIDFDRMDYGDGKGRILLKCDNTNCKHCLNGQCSNLNMIEESNKNGAIICEEAFVNFKLKLCEKSRVKITTDLGNMDDPVDRRIYVDEKPIVSMSNDSIDGGGNAIDLLNKVLRELGIKVEMKKLL